MAIRQKDKSKRDKRRVRIRKKVNGTPERPRLTIYRSLKHTYAQLFDDTAELLETLDEEDHYHRFFSSYRPKPAFFAELANVAAVGGRRLVAVVVSGEQSRIVAEAGYTRLPNGDGELAITVERPWRGWLERRGWRHTRVRWSCGSAAARGSCATSGTAGVQIVEAPKDNMPCAPDSAYLQSTPVSSGRDGAVMSRCRRLRGWVAGTNSIASRA